MTTTIGRHTFRVLLLALLALGLLMPSTLPANALAGDGTVYDEDLNVIVRGTFVPGLNSSDGRTSNEFACEAASAVNTDAQPVAAVKFRAEDGCQMEFRPAGSNDPTAWTVIATAPGRTLPGAVTVTAEASTSLAGQFRVCFQAEVEYTDGTERTTKRGCSDGSTGNESANVQV